jgi:hypothetical protein
MPSVMRKATHIHCILYIVAVKIKSWIVKSIKVLSAIAVPRKPTNVAQQQKVLMFFWVVTSFGLVDTNEGAY